MRHVLTNHTRKFRNRWQWFTSQMGAENNIGQANSVLLFFVGPRRHQSRLATEIQTNWHLAVAIWTGCAERGPLGLEFMKGNFPFLFKISIFINNSRDRSKLRRHCVKMAASNEYLHNNDNDGGQMSGMLKHGISTEYAAGNSQRNWSNKPVETGSEWGHRCHGNGGRGQRQMLHYWITW